MKTRLFILIFALVASAGTLFAESGTLGDNATWNYADGVLTISGTGAMTDFANLMAVPWNGTEFELNEKQGIKANDFKKIKRVIDENADIIMKRWKEYFEN